jgi:hypothetical protein
MTTTTTINDFVAKSGAASLLFYYSSFDLIIVKISANIFMRLTTAKKIDDDYYNFIHEIHIKIFSLELFLVSLFSSFFIAPD